MLNWTYASMILLVRLDFSSSGKKEITIPVKYSHIRQIIEWTASKYSLNVKINYLVVIKAKQTLCTGHQEQLY